MKNFRKVLAGCMGLLVSSIVFVSCMKDSTTSLQAVGDIIVQDLKTDDGVKYSITVYVTANFEILSGKIIAPGTGGKVYQLTPLAGNKYQCVYSPKASDYTTDMPVKGDYTMEITSTNGEILYGKDTVGDEKLTPIAIKSSEVSSGTAKITWDKVTGADAYVVRLYSADKSTILFSSDYLISTLTEYNLNTSLPGWIAGTGPVVGTNYVVELLGIRVETNVLTDKGSNLQFITIDSKTIKWQ
jgi:hypothetical protein